MQLFGSGTALHLFRYSALAIVFWVLTATPSLQAEEPYAEFLEGLRQRKFFDTALEYLDELEARPNVAAEFAQTLELERGITYREMGTASRIPEDRELALSKAEAALKAFTSGHPNHPRAAFANFELGQLLLERARSIIWEAEAPANSERRVSLQQQARGLVEQAQAIYQKAHDQYFAKYKSYPTFIDQNQEPDLYEERQGVFNKYLRAWYNLVRCTYENGQTYDKGTQERKDTLIKASEQFEEIHNANRSTVIGRLARLMMGKCFQEQDDIARALGLYNEIKDDKSEHPTAMLLKAYAIQFRLICLNHEQKQDYQLVIREATEWLDNKLNRSRLFTEQGLGILWERAIAEEKLAQQREIDARQKTAILRQAAADAKQVARFPSPYKEPALAMSRRINAALGESDAEPRDFDTAFERGKNLITELKNLTDDLDNAKTPADKDKARQAIDGQLNEIGRLFNLALSMQDDRSDPQAVAQARYLLSYVYLRQRKSLDAVILSRYVMTRHRTSDPDSALSATEIAIAAAVQAFNDAGEENEFELNLLKDICELIISQYSQSARGNEARIRLGQVYRDLDEPLKAAEIYLTVPAEYSEYPSARMQAGQAYWLAWAQETSALQQADVDQPAEDTTETLNQYRANATKLLQEGLQLASDKLGENGRPTAEMAAAEVTLAAILNMNGKFQETVQRLTSGGENSIVQMVDVADGQARPEKGIQSAAFASQTYRLLLRAYIGTQQVDQALATMNQLEAVGGQDMAAVYTELGRELKEELERRRNSGQQEELARARADFEAFLGKVYEQRDSNDYNSLLWIGETYFGLGQGTSDDPAKASDYFQRAASAYEEILNNNLVTGPTAEGTITAIRLRIIRSRRALGQFESAIDLAQQVLSKSPLNLDVQFEAAYTLADWGADATAGQPDKLLLSIDGIKSGDSDAQQTVWGWSGITRRLQARQSTPEWDEYKDRFLEARYEYINSRYRYAKTNAPEAEAQLKAALGELTIFAQVFPDLDDAWFSKFDQLYRNIQTELGQAPLPLERPEPIEVVPETPEVAEGTDPDQAEPATTEEPAGTTAPAEPQEGPGLIVWILVFGLAGGGGFAFYKVMSKPRQKRRSFAPDQAPKVPLPPASGDSGDEGGMPDFSNLGDIAAPAGGVAVAAPARKAVRKKAAEPSTAEGTRPAKKKRVLTPEEAAKYKAAKAARAAKAAKAEAASNAGSQPAAGSETAKKSDAAKAGEPQQGSGTKKKLVRRKLTPEQAAAAKKKVRRRPPPPAEPS
ncbi:MAG: hypothetical protein Fues2KO_38430 [Fuerstiella sp.]